jgi:hypothetical protein
MCGEWPEAVKLMCLSRLQLVPSLDHVKCNRGNSTCTFVKNLETLQFGNLKLIDVCKFLHVFMAAFGHMQLMRVDRADTHAVS